ncbi:hypothetical protein BU24DRAFT_215006 [Aaosphaeria arxii CBS 175.79]|uniref:Zn(2)-C6 fungal-type domain-containing protein n=1 Tax=Aaosphaeria arxii CBS 175.79 TaxID=1450172 RepID=A0A6A5XNH3_9PLEO|nr:uncharacterized protein BU24DRAFT_215006 [Aaosphaeria arxii CBS 175.79]KAF2014483.1 hypothetical protein BU24DRAFT_215006 [Aaosphaeria arxii CBS 175.79]
MTGLGFPARLRVSHQNRTLNKNFRRNGKLQSCEPCRKGKLRCDHMMPHCGRCIRRNKTEQCVYHPAPLTKATAIPTPEPSETAASSTVVCQEESNSTFATLSFPRPDSPSTTPPRLPRASSLPAQPPSNQEPLCSDELGQPLHHTEALDEPMKHRRKEEFISHSAIVAENELSVGILPAPHLGDSTGHSRIPQSHIERGALVLGLLKNLPQLDVYIQKLFQFCQGTIIIEPMVKIWVTELWSTWRKVLESQRPEELRKMSEKVWENTTKPLSRLLDRHTKPREFLMNTTGEHLRWEVVGIITSLVGLLTQTLQDGDPIFCSHDEAPVDRTALTLKTFNASEVCLSFCKDYDIVNDLFIWFLYEQTVLACSLHSKGSYYNWQRSSYVCQALIAFGLHQKIEVDDQTPFFIAEFRKRVFISQYDNDKYSASFVGRPPRLTRQYCLLQFPLDLTDAQIMSDGFALEYALTNLDQEGWNTHGSIQRCTISRVFAANALLMEETLEISLGLLSTEEILSRAADIERRVIQTWENMPPFLKIDTQNPYDAKRAPVELLFQTLIRLADFNHHFLLQRTLIKKVGADSTKLLAVSRDIFKFILCMANNRDIFRDFQLDYTQLLCMFLPAAAVVAVELLHQEQEPVAASAAANHLPRSETIQDLSVMVATLASVKADSAAYKICDRGRRFIKKTLDTILSPPRLEAVASTSGNDSYTTTSNLDVPLFQTGTDGDFMKWLESMDWEQDNWANLT